jgi:hypothetical protein
VFQEKLSTDEAEDNESECFNVAHDIVCPYMHEGGTASACVTV